MVDFEGFVKKTIKTLEKSRVEYVLIGGVVALHYGRPRTTLDCDVIVSMGEEDLESFYELFKKEGFEIRLEDIKEAYKEKSHFNAYYKDSPFRIDFSFPTTSIEKKGMERSKVEEIFGVEAKVQTAEDIILAKLKYGSEQDMEDAKAITERKKDLDINYLKQRSKEEKILDKLEKIL